MTAYTGRRSAARRERRAPSPLSSSVADSVSVEIKAALQAFGGDEVPAPPPRRTRNTSQPSPSTADQRGRADASSSPRSTRTTRRRKQAHRRSEPPYLLRRIPEQVVLDAMTMSGDARAALVQRIRADMDELHRLEIPRNLAVSARRNAQWILTEISRMPQSQSSPGKEPHTLSAGMRRRRRLLERAIATRTPETPARQKEDDRIYLRGSRPIYPARGLTSSGGLPTLGKRR